MKHLMTLVALLVSTAAVAQIPTLPWNPDGNDDQYIGLPDLLDLLTVYGQEFENAVLSNDSSSALIFTGVLQFPVCCQSCDELPGHWDVANYREVGPVWDEIRASEEDTWFGDQSYSGTSYQVLYWKSLPVNPAYAYLDGPTRELDAGKRCYCVAKQLPRVEYSVCASSSNNSFRTAASIEACCQQKVSEGWLPLGGTAESDYTVSQAFWRFAQ